MEQKRYILDSSIVFFYDREDITIASFNIIDLIEVGDYINGEKVILKNDGYIEIGTTNDYIGFNNDELVKSIVTKVQFESMSYKL